MKTTLTRTASIFSLALLAVAPVTADAAAPSPTVAPAASAAASTVSDYKLMAGDVITISVPNFTVPNLNSQATIPPDGKISLALIGVVAAAGKTTTQLQDELTKKWNEYVVDPAVSVMLTQKHVDNVTVYGYVVRPGAITFTPPMRLTQAVGAAGGGLPNADMHRVVLTRPNGEKQIIDMSRPDEMSGTDTDVPLGINDVVYVPERRDEVTVVGEVKQPGSYDYKDGMTVSDALTDCGSYLPDTADLKAATLTHNGNTVPLDLDAFEKHGDMSENVKLSSGDVITIPQMHNRIYVYGDVRIPGFYLYKPGDRMLDALQGVGGPNQDADLDKVNLIKIAADKNSANFERVDLGKFLKKGDVTCNPEVQPGDALYIPTKSRGFKMEDMWVALTGLNLLNTGAQAFSRGLGN